jgi:hypothetical protein
VRLLTQVPQLIKDVQVRQREGQAVHVSEGNDAAKKLELHAWHIVPRGLVVC